MVRFENTPPQTGQAVVGTIPRDRHEADSAARAHGHGLSARHAREAAVPDRRRSRVRPRHRRRQARRRARSFTRSACSSALNFRDYGLLTVLINGDEEVSSAGSRTLITKLGSEHDLVLSCEGSGPDGCDPADDRGHRGGAAQGDRPRVACGRRAGAGAQRALRAGAPDPADARSVEPGNRREDELDARDCRQREERHPRRGARHGGRPRAARGGLRRHRAAGPRAHPESADSRYEGGDGVRAHAAAARGDARGACRGRPRAADLQRSSGIGSSVQTPRQAAAPMRRSPRWRRKPL